MSDQPEPQEMRQDAAGEAGSSAEHVSHSAVEAHPEPRGRGAPRIPSRDAQIRRTVRRWMDERPELAHDAYMDLLVVKATLRRHYSKLSSDLQKNGLLTKERKPKAALDALLSISAEIRRIDAELPSVPPPEHRQQSIQMVIRTQEECPSCGASLVPENAINVFDQEDDPTPTRPVDEEEIGNDV